MNHPDKLFSATIKMKHGWFAETCFGSRHFTLFLFDRGKSFHVKEENGSISMKRPVTNLSLYKEILDNTQPGLYEWIHTTVNDLTI